MAHRRHHVVPSGAAPLQRTTTITHCALSAPGGPRRHQHLAAAQRAAAARSGATGVRDDIISQLTEDNVRTISRGIEVMRAQTSLNMDAFAAAVDVVMSSQPSPHREGAPAGDVRSDDMSLEDRVARAQVASADYVRRYGMPTNMVFGAAYMPAIAYAGALAQADRLGLFASVRNWAGTAGGAVIAGLMAAGLPIARVGELAMTTDFARIMHVGWRGGRRFTKRSGLVSGKRFIRAFRDALRHAIIDENITLKALHDLRGGRAVFVTMNLTTSRPVYIDYRTHPDMPLWKAVRMAVSLPAVIEPVEHGGDWFSDGSALAGMPMDVFHYNDPAQPINQRTLGFMAVCDGVNDKPRGSLGANLSAITDAVLSTSLRSAIDEQDRQRIIVIDCGRMSSMDFSLADRGALMDIGATAVVDHFACGARPIANKYGVEHNGFDPEDEPGDAVAVVSSVLQKGKTRTCLGLPRSFGPAVGPHTSVMDTM